MNEDYNSLQAMIDSLPKKIIVVRGRYKPNDVYRLLITKTEQKTKPFVVRYAKQASVRKGGRYYEYFSAKFYCFNYTEKTLIRAVQLMHAQIEDLRQRGYLEEWDHDSCLLKLKSYKEDNQDPTGSFLIDWDDSDIIPPDDNDLDAVSPCILG